MRPMMTLPDLMRLSYRMAFLTLEIQLTVAARLWGISRKVQQEAQAIVDDLPLATALPVLTPDAARPGPGKAPRRAAATPAATGAAAPRSRRPQSRNADTPDTTRLN
ncbi:MAG: hypothetical protein ACK4TB_01060 [Gemmobacter sp.]